MSKFVDLTGKTYGYLTVIERVENHKDHRAYWKCMCKCGGTTIVPTYRLNDGSTKSCGCKKYESHNKKHGMRHTRIYETWCGMIKRCYNKNSKSFKNYGGRGIKVCEEWKNDFSAFNTWAVSSGYSDNLTIERINVNDDYKPENCIWITQVQQQRNKTNSVFLEHNGQRKHLLQWCEELGMNKGAAKSRYKRAKAKNGHVSFDDVFSLPVNYRSKRISQYTMGGGFIKTWDSFMEIARSGLYSRTSVVQCCTGKIKSSGGYVWKYADELPAECEALL